MATFGEISEPSSRTAWEDWDEDYTNEDTSRLQLEKDVEFTEVDTLIILEGKYLSMCVKSQKDLELVNSIKEVNLKLFKSTSQNNYFCIIYDYDLVWSSEIVQLLKPWVTASKNVVAILTKPLVDYQMTEQVTQDCVIRGLYTTKAKSLGPEHPNIDFPKLEQPNMISGVSAGAIALREVLELPATAVVCYIQHHNVYELKRLLEKFKVIPHVDTDHNNLLSSNLYI